jgi:hypothetical protein
MVRRVSFHARIVPRQVDQLAAELRGGQAVEVECGGRRRGLKRAIEANQGVLKHIFGLFPAGHTWISPNHLLGQPAESLVGAFEQAQNGLACSA